jgi:acyl carrier protein
MYITVENNVHHTEILSRINVLIRDIFDEDDLVVTDDTIAEEVDAWDSANHIRLMLAIMEEFNIEFNGREINASENVGELVDLVASKLKA